MASEAIDYLDPPALTDQFDATRYALGVEFTVSESVACTGVRWRVPDTLTPVPGAGYAVSLFQDGTGLVRQQTFSPVAGGDQDIPWTAQGDFTLTPGNTYIAQVYTERYTFRGSSSYPYATPSGIASAVRARLLENATDDDQLATGNSTSARFYVSPLIEVEDADHTTTGTAAATALATAATATTRITSEAATGAATAAATSTTTRITSGASTALATVTATAATVRTTTGSARALALATAVTATVRTTVGSAVALARAGVYTAAGAPGPWLIDRHRAAPIVDRVRRA